jgi:hypothetical protein
MNRWATFIRPLRGLGRSLLRCVCRFSTLSFKSALKGIEVNVSQTSASACVGRRVCVLAVVQRLSTIRSVN